MAAETPGFMIDGTEYPLPSLDSFDMDEAQVMYDYCGLTLEDFAPLALNASQDEKDEHEAGLVRRTKHPGFLRTLMHVAYQRGNPEIKSERVNKLIGQAKVVDALVGTSGEDDAGPPEISSQNEPSKLSDSRKPSRLGDSGIHSSNGSDQPEEIPVATGTSESDTSSPESAHTVLVP